MSISAFTEPFIADQKAYDLYDIVKWSPGVHQDNISPQGWVRYNIRGFNSAAVQRNGFGSFRFIDTTNISRVEVVKGPSSLLYGQINPGGVINYNTKRPEAKPELRLTAALGDFGYYRVVLDATGPIPGSEDKLLYRAIAMAENIQRFHVLSRGTKTMLAPSFTWKISERTSLTVDYEHFEREEDMLTSGVVLAYVNGVAARPYPGLPWNFSYAGEGDFQNFISNALTAELTTRVGEHVNIRAAYLDSWWDMEWRATGQGGTGLLPQSFIDAFYPPSARLTSADAMYRRNRWEHQWGGERTGHLDVVGRFNVGSVKIQVAAGRKENFRTHLRAIQKNNPNDAANPLYLKPWDLRDPSTWDRAVPFGVESLVLAAHTQNASEGSSTFGVISATAFDERVRVLGGYARHQLHNQPTRDLVSQTSTAATSRAANIPQVGALVELMEGVSAFVSYSESFLANTNMLRVNNVPALPAAPSVGKGWETGLKLDLLEGRISGTLSVYRVKASPTGIVTVTTGVDDKGTTLFTDIQGGSQLSEGFELDLLFTPLPGLQIMAGFSRCDAVYELHPTSPALNNTPLVATPERTFSVWGKYQFSGGRLDGLSIGGGLSYVGSSTHVANNPFVRIDPYTTVDLTFGYRVRAFGREWNADLSVKNVTNKRYYGSAASWGFPRHGMLSLSTRF
jgi:iron complex outermembrane receptor protein